LKQKDLVGVPWRVAFALQEDGWYLRQDIIWHKPNPMPESVRDRCTKAHEYVFLMSKNSRYFFDANSIAEKAINAGKTVKKINPLTAKNAAKGRFGLTAVGFTEHDTAIKDRRNRRSVWSIPTRPYRGAHFATMPPALVEPCILAGSREGDTILDPFTGSGTTGAVAISLGRLFVGAELNDEYAAMAQNRIGAALEDRKKMLLMKESQMMFREETT
jgi:DNA modification methylase